MLNYLHIRCCFWILNMGWQSQRRHPSQYLQKQLRLKIRVIRTLPHDRSAAHANRVLRWQRTGPDAVLWTQVRVGEQAPAQEQHAILDAGRSRVLPDNSRTLPARCVVSSRGQRLGISVYVAWMNVSMNSFLQHSYIFACKLNISNLI